MFVSLFHLFYTYKYLFFFGRTQSLLLYKRNYVGEMDSHIIKQKFKRQNICSRTHINVQTHKRLVLMEAGMALAQMRNTTATMNQALRCNTQKWILNLKTNQIKREFDFYEENLFLTCYNAYKLLLLKVLCVLLYFVGFWRSLSLIKSVNNTSCVRSNIKFYIKLKRSIHIFRSLRRKRTYGFRYDYY